MKKYEEPKMKLHELKMKAAMLQQASTMKADTQTSSEGKSDLEDFEYSTTSVW